MSTYSLSPEIAEKYGCGESRQIILKEAKAAEFESLGINSDFDFFATAPNLSGSQPGDILQIKPMNVCEVALPTGVAAYKIQYLSVNIDGPSVAPTALVGFPLPSKTSNLLAPLIAPTK